MSHKKSYKELRESIRKEICQNYKHRIEFLQSRIDALTAQIKSAKTECYEAKEKLCEAKNKLEHYEDWIERLCDYCNLSNEERQLLLEETDWLKRRARKSESFEKYIQDNSLIFSYLYFLTR